MKTKSTTCKDVYNRICDNLDQDLNSPQCREIRRHLDDCPNCVAYLDSLKRTISLYREYPNPKVPGKTHKELLAQVSVTAKRNR